MSRYVNNRCNWLVFKLTAKFECKYVSGDNLSDKRSMTVWFQFTAKRYSLFDPEI